MDPFAFLRLLVTSFFANIVVIGLLVSLIIMALGTLLLPLNRNRGVNLLLNGIILCGVLSGLSAMQLGAIPATFNAVARAGLYTFPLGPAMDVYTTIMGWILRAVSFISSLFMIIGMLIMLGSHGHSGWKPFLMGFVMEMLGTLIGGGGIISVIMHFVGISVPVLM
nr:hypothetical protein [Candidatus Sigynarchaeota archaeon]